MIGLYLKEGYGLHRDQMALICGSESFTYGDIGERVNVLVEILQELAHKRVGVCVTSPVSFIATVTALDLLQSHAFLVGPQRLEAVPALQTKFAWDQTLYEEDILAAISTKGKSRSVKESLNGSGLVTILTSGTTGAPKAVTHNWATLASSVRRDSRYAGTRWLLTYPLNLYAGAQVFLQGFLNWATLVTPISSDPGTICCTLRDHRVTHASGTPTFWRQLLLWGRKDVLQASELEQITMGGEVATQELLDSLRVTFPRARIVHIYASTELGRMFSVTDGKEGFPAKFLQELAEEGMALRIVDGELMARPRHQMISCDLQKPLCEETNGWMATGDLVELSGDRVLFRGRKNDVINVGGRKVSPLQVEATLRGLPGIVDVRVYAKKSSMIGHLVAADVVLAPGVREETFSAELRRAASQALQPHEIPRIVRIVPHIVSNEALKTVRSEQP